LPIDWAGIDGLHTSLANGSRMQQHHISFGGVRWGYMIPLLDKQDEGLDMGQDMIGPHQMLGFILGCIMPA
jgi:hypothetical protein